MCEVEDKMPQRKTEALNPSLEIELPPDLDEFVINMTYTYQADRVLESHPCPLWV